MERTESAEERAIREIAAEDDDAMAYLQRSLGPPPGSRQLSEADEDEAWETADPSVVYEQVRDGLMAGGLPPEVVQRLRVVELRPQWAELFTKRPASLEEAEILARSAQFPFRLSLLEGQDPHAMVRAAERLQKRYEKKRAPQPPPEPAPRIAELPQPALQARVPAPMPAPPLPPAGPDGPMPMPPPPAAAAPLVGPPGVMVPQPAAPSSAGTAPLPMPPGRV